MGSNLIRLAFIWCNTHSPFFGKNVVELHFTGGKTIFPPNITFFRKNIGERHVVGSITIFPKKTCRKSVKLISFNELEKSAFKTIIITSISCLWPEIFASEKTYFRQQPTVIETLGNYFVTVMIKFCHLLFSCIHLVFRLWETTTSHDQDIIISLTKFTFDPFYRTRKVQNFTH